MRVVLSLFFLAYSLLASAQWMERTIQVDGRDRAYLVQVPPTIGLHPLIIGFHGGGSTAEQFRSQSGLQDYTREHILVYPQGWGRTWNAWTCCGRAVADNVDDVKFVRAILLDLDRLHAEVDRHRVYATGFSNGASLVYRLACEASDIITAVAPHSGARLDTANCRPLRPVPIMHVHGLVDERAPIEGGPGRWSEDDSMPPIADVISFWAQNNGCSLTASSYILPGAICQARLFCQDRAEVLLCVVPRLGHQWAGASPSEEQIVRLGPARPDVKATPAMLRFFSRQEWKP